MPLPPCGWCSSVVAYCIESRPGDVAHRREQRQAAGAVFDGFERHRGEADVAQPARELGQRREVQITEQQVVLAQALQVGLDGLLDLDDHLGFGEQLIGGRQHRDADIAKVLVRIATLLAGAVLDEHFMSAAHQLDAGCGNKSDSPLAGFQLTRNANTHGMSPLTCALGRTGQRACPSTRK